MGMECRIVTSFLIFKPWMPLFSMAQSRLEHRALPQGIKKTGPARGREAGALIASSESV
jgi:hypothetical protein